MNPPDIVNIFVVIDHTFEIHHDLWSVHDQTFFPEVRKRISLSTSVCRWTGYLSIGVKSRGRRGSKRIQGISINMPLGAATRTLNGRWDSSLPVVILTDDISGSDAFLCGCHLNGVDTVG